MTKPNSPASSTAPTLRRTALAVALSGLFALPMQALPQVTGATITVDGTDCTLAEAILNANNNTNGGQDPNDGNGCAAGIGADTIVLPMNSTQTLSQALPDISSAIILEGKDSTVMRSSASGTPVFSVLKVTSTGNMEVRRTTVTGGKTFTYGGGLYNLGVLTITESSVSGNYASSKGGGVYNKDGTLTITDSSVSGNSSNSRAGGVYSKGGTLTIADSTISGNSARVSVGGVYNRNGIASIDRSTISGNRTQYGSSGGVFNYFGTLTLTNSTVSGNNSSSFGGGVNTSYGSLTITNSTVSGNTARNNGGGGIANKKGVLTIIHSTVTGNSAGAGAGITLQSGANTTTLSASIVSANIGDDLDLFGTNTSSITPFISGGNNLIGDGDGTAPFTQPGDVTGNTDPGLSALADNGGPTQTHALVTGSPAIDTAGSTCTATPTDQRGVKRPKDGNASSTAECDSGAFEAGTNSVDLAITSTDDVTTSASIGDTITYTIKVQNDGPDGAAGAMVADQLPSSLTFESVSTSQGSCTQALGNVSCELGAIGATGAKGAATLTLKAKTTAAGMVSNTASVMNDLIDSDINPGNNSATETTTVAAAADTKPNQFSFTDVTGVAVGSTQTAGPISVGGIDAAVAIAVSGAPSSKFAILPGSATHCGGATFVTAASTVVNGQKVCVQHTASSSFSTKVDTLLTLGTSSDSVSDTFSSTTAAAASPTVQFTTASSSINEGDKRTRVTVNISMNQPATTAVTIPLTFGGTAKAGSDYSGVPHSVTIPVGQSKARITIKPVDDKKKESNETVVLTMGTPTNATLGSQTRHTLTIVDND